MSVEEYEAICAQFRVELTKPDMRPSQFVWAGAAYPIRWSLM